MYALWDWTRRLVVFAFLIAPAVVAAQVMRVHFIDVGQGAATLVEFPCAAILIDTGGEDPNTYDSAAALVSYLDEFFLRRPELDRTLASLILTHPHIDHTRGGTCQ